MLQDINSISKDNDPSLAGKVPNKHLALSVLKNIKMI